ncbi:S-adenosyl-L-methionine-dependent methyltransferase [Apodospora peruviana]|uniref:S-adenosyl-L-methionine-dependent methyltransferase n=1 Tax=Apodospora peruviana TaxID=516989 RepID=A0AAE0M2I7_9PEZI|nr:S-adenosyl-L-methionine-dependent methyltransferase [Apodospora peruviana]
MHLSFTSVANYLFLFSILTTASPVITPTTTDLATTLPTHEEDTSPAAPALRGKRQNHTNSAIIQVRACVAKAVAAVPNDPLRTLRMDINQILGLYVAGALLAFGGELSEIDKRITLLTIRTAYNSAAYLLPTLEAMKQDNPCLPILNVGAGSGSISAAFAQIVGPEGPVTALDVNPDTIPRFKAVAEEMGVIDRISFQQGEVHMLPVEDGVYDVVHCHQILAHVNAPWDALREMMRVAKPGGVVAAREGDWETEIRWPELPGLVKFHAFAGSMLVGHGGSKSSGRQLLSWALRAGAERSQITPSFGPSSYTGRELKKIYGYHSGRPPRPLCVKAGVKSGLTDADFDEMEKDFEAWIGMDDGILAMMHGEILIQK